MECHLNDKILWKSLYNVHYKMIRNTTSVLLPSCICGKIYNFKKKYMLIVDRHSYLKKHLCVKKKCFFKRMKKFSRGFDKDLKYLNVIPNCIDRIDLIPKIDRLYYSLMKQIFDKCVYEKSKELKYDEQDISNLQNKYKHYRFKYYSNCDVWLSVNDPNESGFYEFGANEGLMETLIVLVKEQKNNFLLFLLKNKNIMFGKMSELWPLYFNVLMLYIKLNSYRLCNTLLTIDDLYWIYNADCNKNTKLNDLNTNNNYMNYLFNILVTINMLLENSSKFEPYLLYREVMHRLYKFPMINKIDIIKEKLNIHMSLDLANIITQYIQK